jgi:hypothetical protein
VVKIVEGTYRYAEQFLQGHKLSSKSLSRAWKPVTEGEIYVVLGLFMLMGIIQKPTQRSYFTTKRVISTRDRLQVFCKFLHFADNESFNNFQGPKKLFKIFPVMSHLNNRFQELYLPIRDISID